MVKGIRLLSESSKGHAGSNPVRSDGGDNMITMHIPEGTQPFDVKSELMSARNIKDKENRKRTLEGLNKIRQWL